MLPSKLRSDCDEDEDDKQQQQQQIESAMLLCDNKAMLKMMDDTINASNQNVHVEDDERTAMLDGSIVAAKIDHKGAQVLHASSTDHKSATKMVGTVKVGDSLSSSNDPMIKYMLKVREDHARDQKKDYSHVFRPKSRFDLIRLSAIVMGIEFAYAAETAFVSPILLQIGIDHKHMTMVWGLSPLLGFFMAPLLGSISDRCKLKFGRRRPIITLLSIGILFGLLLVPHGKNLGALLGDVGFNSPTNISMMAHNATEGIALALTSSVALDDGPSMSNFKFAVIFVILGTILLDFDADTCQTPARAYLLDVCIPEDQPKALSTFTVMAGLGGTIGYGLGGINWEATSFGNMLGGNIPTVFAIVTIIFVLCFLVTITSFREIPLELIEKDELLRPLSAEAIKKENRKNYNPVFYVKETTTLELHMAQKEVDRQQIISDQLSGEKSYQNSIPFKSDVEAIAGDIDEPISLGQYLKSIVIMPKSMRVLALTNLLCWMAHVCYCLYFTDFVGEAVFHGDPGAAPGSEAHTLYVAGVQYGCWGMAIYAMSCSIYSMCVEKLMKIFSTKSVYIGGILSYALGMLILAIWPTKLGVLLLSITAGIIYATLFTMPFILVAAYHSKSCFKVRSGENIPLKHARGLGTDIAIISSMVFVAQLIVSLSVGSFVSLLGSTAAVIYAASGLSLLAAISALFVLYV